MMARYAVVGNPVAHSLSPRIHAAFAAALGQDMRYETLEPPVGGFDDAVGAFFQTGGSGLNVTVPFKEDAWRWVDAHDAAAAGAGAVNTILMRGERTRGCNTDGIGLVRDIRVNLGWALAGARTAILGAGGATRGIVMALQHAGVANLTIANRTRAKAELLGTEFGVRALGLDELDGGWDLIINATSAGLSGIGPSVAPQALVGARCYDLHYAIDGGTPFVRWAEARGARSASDGLGMLVEQAAEAFRLWRGVTPRTPPVLRALRDTAR